MPETKPTIDIAMRDLISQIKATTPFDLPESQICSGVCLGCSKKLLDFLMLEVDDWTCRLDQGERPNFEDLHKLARNTKKIHRILKKNGLMA